MARNPTDWEGNGRPHMTTDSIDLGAAVETLTAIAANLEKLKFADEATLTGKVHNSWVRSSHKEAASIQVVLEALARSREQPEGWRDIESAPKDGTIIDLWFVGGGMDPKNVHACRQTGRWRKADQYGHAGWTAGVFVPDPDKFTATHWMPLPAPPTKPGEEGS